MGRRKNNNPQKAGTRGPGRKSRKQQPPDGLGNMDLALNVHEGSRVNRSPQLRSSERGAKMRAQTVTATAGKPGQRHRKDEPNLPEVIVKAHEGEPLKSALKTPSPKGTVSSTISKLTRQRSGSPSKGQATDVDRKVKFNDENDVREMTLSETEEDRQPLASTLMSILSSFDIGPPARKQKRRKKLAVPVRKSKLVKNPDTLSAETGLEPAGSSADTTENDVDEDGDDIEIEVPADTPMDLLHALVSMANAHAAGRDGNEEDVDRNDAGSPDDDVSETSTQNLRDDFAKALLSVLNIHSKTPTGNKKTKKGKTGSTSVEARDSELDTGGHTGQLLDNADVDDIEKLNEQVVMAVGGTSLKSSKRPAGFNSLTALLTDKAGDYDEESSSDEDFEPTAADFAQAELDARYNPNDLDESEDDDLVHTDHPADGVTIVTSAPSQNNFSATLGSMNKASPTNSSKTTPQKKALEPEPVDDIGIESGKNSMAFDQTKSPQPTVMPVKGRRSINDSEPKGNDDVIIDSNTDKPPPITENVQLPDDLIVSATHGRTSLAASQPNMPHEMPSMEDQMMLNRGPEQLAIIDSRIHETIQTLASFDQYQKQQSDAGQSAQARSHFVNQLVQDLCTYYSYNEFLMRKLVDLFQFGELVEFLEANEAPRPVTIRVNSLKARRKTLAETLIQRGVNLDPIPGDWTKVGLVIYDSKVPIGATPEYLAGHYMLQGASSLLPVMALAPQPGNSVLDMCAAPGGKSTHIAAVMKNTGMLVANDPNRARCKAIVANMCRMGVVSGIVSSVDGRKLPESQQKYDRVLLDAPCSGTGVLSRDPSAKVSKNEQDMLRITTLQKELILAGIRCLKPNGVLVYSTCSVLVEENEAVVNYALNKCQGLKLAETSLTFGVNGFVRFRQHRFHQNMKFTKRFYPHEHNMDGFFVAKMRLCGSAKFSDAPSGKPVSSAFASGVVSEHLPRKSIRKVGVNKQWQPNSNARDEEDAEMSERVVPVNRGPADKNVLDRKRRISEGARDRRKRLATGSRQPNSNSFAVSITGDKQREQTRRVTKVSNAGDNSVTADKQPGSDLAVVKPAVVMNGFSHVIKKPAEKLTTPTKPVGSGALVIAPASATTQKEPPLLFQRLKNRVDSNRSSAAPKKNETRGQPVGVEQLREKKKSVAVSVADTAERKSRKVIEKNKSRRRGEINGADEN